MRGVTRMRTDHGTDACAHLRICRQNTVLYINRMYKLSIYMYLYGFIQL